MDVCHSFLKKARESGLVEPADRIIIGVSGGVDSVVLLDILSRLESEEAISIFIAHVNYGLRGRESDRDEAFVKKLAKRYCVKFCSCKACFAKHGRASSATTNIQNAARDIRYKFFLKTAKKVGANKIALAHHADDQAETMLLHLTRGAGLSGLGGMSEVRDLSDGVKLIRPLLNLTKEEIIRYAKERRLRFVQDSSNRTKKYHRNVIRHDILPLLQKYNPNVVNHLCKTAAILMDENEALDDIATRAFVRLCVSSLVKPSHQIAFKRPSFIKYSIAIQRRMLRMAYARLTGSTADLLTDHIDKMMWIISSDNKEGRYNLPNGVEFIRKGNTIILTDHKK